MIFLHEEADPRTRLHVEREAERLVRAIGIEPSGDGGTAGESDAAGTESGAVSVSGNGLEDPAAGRTGGDPGDLYW